MLDTKMPYFPVYVKDWLTWPNLMELTSEQVGWFFFLALHSWLAEGYLPTGATWWTLARAESNRFDQEGDAVLALFQQDESGKIYQPELRQLYLNQVEKAEQKSAAGKKAAESRWAKGLTNSRQADAVACHSDAEPDAESEANAEPKPNAQPEAEALSPEGETALEESSTLNHDLVPTLREIFNYYLQKTDRNPNLYSLTDSRCKKGLDILLQARRKWKDEPGKAERAMRFAIDKIASSDFHMGRDPKTNGRRFCEWELHLFKNWECFERWLNR
jgi:uncharacterized protein YdaU (DUF1376 family)